MGAELTPRQQRMEDAGTWLAKAAGTATPGDLGNGLGLVNRKRQAEVLTDLAAAGLITRGGGLVTMTPEGWARFAEIGPGSAGDVLDRVLIGWPARHRVFLELVVCSVIARYHLAAAYPRHPHLGFMAIGETATGKSAMAELVCHLFGFDQVLTCVHTPAETTGSLLGRRCQTSEGWTWEPAPMTRRPFLFLDEFDKADQQVQARAWNYFRGTVTTPAEGEVHQLLPTPMLGANPPAKGERLGALRSEYRRRSVVLDTSAMAGRGRELEKHLSRFYASTTPADRLSLTRLVPPAALDREALEVFEAGEQALTPAGLAEFPGGRVLELVTLGRLALLGPDASHLVAAAATMAAYLTVTESVPGQVADGWQPALAEWASDVAGGEPLMAALERSSRAKAEALGQATTNRRRVQHVSEAILQTGAELAERCRLARAGLAGTKVPDEHKPAAAGLRKRLAHHQDSAAKVSTARGLEDITALAAPALAEAGRLLATVSTTRDQVEIARREHVRERQQAREAGKQRTAWEVQQRRVRRASLAAGLDQVRAEAKPLEVLWNRKAAKPGEVPRDVLSRLRVNGNALLSYRPAAAEEERLRGWALLTYQRPLGWWVIAGTNGSGYYRGTHLGCAALDDWGQGTQAVLAPTLAQLHRLEDDLVRELGRKPRQRPDVSSSPRRAVEARRN